MTAQSTAIRQGLPRYPGGEPWPPLTEGAPLAALNQPAPAETAPIPKPPIPPATHTVAAPTSHPSVVRQGLPRTPGGEPWPQPTLVSIPAPAASVLAGAPIPEAHEAAASATARPAAAHSSVLTVAAARADVRQGLPRTSAGPAWPPMDSFPEQATTENVMSTAVAAPVTAVTSPAAALAVAVPAAPEAAATSAQATPAASKPPKTAAGKTPEAKKYSPLTFKQWSLAGVLGAFCALGMATALVLLARWVAGFEAVVGYLDRYPGEYHLPENTPVGMPGWLGWQHFFNFFLMVLIIRSGMLVRHQQKPPAFWSSKRSPKVSINLWLHQSLDVLWLANGVVFLVLLFATGHWMRIVPTSWEVFPNAISAGIQYLTLDWPTENGWVNYNSLQQLAYFTTVFIAAPVAAITGYRMSAFWPKNAKVLSNAYPLELARKLHFPTMLYFVMFIFIHVALVLSTGALRNLNHMYAAQGSVDPAEYADNWMGLFMFGASLLVIVGAWIACRPMLLTPLAQLFGKVTSR